MTTVQKFLCFLVLAIPLTACHFTPRDVTVVYVNDTVPNINSVVHPVEDYKPLKVAVSAILSPRETYESYEEIFSFITAATGRPVEFFQRKTYQEINRMLENRQLDFAFICSGAYIELDTTKGVELMVVPVSGGRKTYKSYIVVHQSFKADKLEDLRNSSFAFTDPLSNSGYLYIKYRLNGINETPDSFFGSTVFTYGHDISLQMVSRGIVESASVSNLVYEYLKAKSPERVRNVKVIEESPDFGIPPVVVSRRLNPEDRDRIKHLFLEMHNDPTGKAILEKLLIDRFVPGMDSDYESIREMRPEK